MTSTTEQTGAPVVQLGLPLVGGSHTRTQGHGTAGLETTDAERSERLAAVREGRLGSVHSWELVTAVDGPGTRLTIFLSGCPLRCLYCHNPDTMEMRRDRRRRRRAPHPDRPLPRCLQGDGRRHHDLGR